MKNKFTFIPALGLILFVALGCSMINPFGSSDESSGADSGTSESTGSTDSTDSTSSGGDIVKVGIAECDELATYINDNAEAIGDESIVVRGIVEMYKQTIFSNLRDSVKNMNDEEKKTMGENCAKALENLKKQVKPK